MAPAAKKQKHAQAATHVTNDWCDKAAKEAIAKYSHLPQNAEDFALRTYSSQLIGKNPYLVLHGGGNTSVKLPYTMANGTKLEVIAVKGSGWDLMSIEPQGFPEVDLAHLRSLRKLPSLSDEEMVNQLKSHQMKFSSPTPSVETLLHAYLPYKWVDHSHADAVLALLDQQDYMAVVKKVYGTKLGVLPYIMPGFGLAKAAADYHEKNPNIEGLLLVKHGLFTFGKTAKESYTKHIEVVQQAEAFMASLNTPSLTLKPSAAAHSPTDIFVKLAPLLRGLFYQQSNGSCWVCHLRTSQEAIDFAGSQEAADWAMRGPLTPDHVLRTKALPMLLQDVPMDADDDAVTDYLVAAIAKFTAAYDEYFNNYNKVFVEKGASKVQLDKLPRILLVQGAGILSIALTSKACKIAADIYEHTIPVIKVAMTIDNYEPPSGQDLFDCEYWSLEQAKLGKGTPPPLQGKVVYVTGAGSGIGLETAQMFGKAGAAVVISDYVQESVDKTVKEFKSQKIECIGLRVDVTDAAAVAVSIGDTVKEYGGIDIIVSNAGRPPASVLMADCDPKLLQSQFDLNFFAHQYVAAAAVKVMLRQGYGGCLLFNASKAAFNPGPKIGPYAIAKAAVVALSRQYALEYGPEAIRANCVNADRVRTGLFTEEVIQARSKARGVTPDQYFANNLLQKEVLASHVAKGFLDLATSMSTTAAVLTIDGGNIAASVR